MQIESRIRNLGSSLLCLTGDDVLAWAMNKCPLQSLIKEVLPGKTERDGRSLKPLREKVKRLASNMQTKFEADIVSKYISKAQAIHELSKPT